jgi:hypothetical protein
MVAMVIRPKRPAVHQLLALVGRNLGVPLTLKPPPAPSGSPRAVATVDAVVVIAVIGGVCFVVVVVAAEVCAAGLRAGSRAGATEDVAEAGLGEKLEDLLLGYWSQRGAVSRCRCEGEVLTQRKRG